MIHKVLTYLNTPNTKKQQQTHLKTIKKLMKYQSVKDCLYNNFFLVIKSLNISLVDFVIKELNIDLNGVFKGCTALTWIGQQKKTNKYFNIYY